MLESQRPTPQPRWPERSLTSTFVRKVAKAGRYCDGHGGQKVNH